MYMWFYIFKDTYFEINIETYNSIYVEIVSIYCIGSKYNAISSIEAKYEIINFVLKLI